MYFENIKNSIRVKLNNITKFVFTVTFVCRYGSTRITSQAENSGFFFEFGKDVLHFRQTRK